MELHLTFAGGTMTGRGPRLGGPISVRGRYEVAAAAATGPSATLANTMSTTRASTRAKASGVRGTLPKGRCRRRARRLPYLARRHAGPEGFADWPRRRSCPPSGPPGFGVGSVVQSLKVQSCLGTLIVELLIRSHKSRPMMVLPSSIVPSSIQARACCQATTVGSSCSSGSGCMGPGVRSRAR